MSDIVMPPLPTHLRGVNLGGWLLLEKWMKPSLFEGLAATDETTYCAELGDEAPARLRTHWENFITRKDFEWLAGVGINAVRIPIGHWIFGPPYPYHGKYGPTPYPFVEGGIDVLDRAFDWAAEFGICITIDLHAAPGCQNGFDNGGIKDVCEWHTREEYITHSVEVLGRLAERYRSAPALFGIQLLNEPAGTWPRRCFRHTTYAPTMRSAHTARRSAWPLSSTTASARTVNTWTSCSRLSTET